MDNDIITIYENDIDIAQNICSSISDSGVRNRAVANVLAVRLAERFFKSKNLESDISTGLHNIPKVIESLDIADIYLNGSYIDVRVYFSNDELSVPKFHFDLGINPAAYMFIRLNSDLSGYNVAGFIRPEQIDKTKLRDDYYYIDENILVSYYDIESHLVEVPETFDTSKEMLYGFVDGSIDENGVAALLKVLVSSANARKTLIKAFKANMLFKYVSAVPSENISGIEKDNETRDEEFNDAAATVQDEGITENDLNDIFDENNNTDSADLFNSLEYSTEITPNVDIENSENDTNSPQDSSNEQIDSLFNEEKKAIPVGKKGSSSKRILLLLIALIAACGFYAYTSMMQQDNNLPPEDSIPAITDEQLNNIEQPVENTVNKEEPMPNETVNTASGNPIQTEDATSVAIPAIEQHLDASVLVSNLKVDWEVPAGYASNTSAKRYLIKLGKVIQLNLKSELLLLTKPPISNRITVELTYNADREKFEIVGINDSSGEKSVDEVIMNTIRSALNMSTSSNIESFGKLQGNPILIIHL